MDGRERWQALQAHLSGARQALNEGDLARTIAEVNAALAIDPEFAAARALSDRLTASEPPSAMSVGLPPGADASATLPTDYVTARAGVAAPRPLVSAEGFARFEERARRRRIERRAAAARSAIAARKFQEATSAIDEIRDLDPNAPEIFALRDAADEVRRMRAVRAAVWHRGPQVAAAAAFATILLAASWLENSNSLLSYPMSIVTALVSTAQPAPLNATAAIVETPSVGTSGNSADDHPTTILVASPPPVVRSSPVVLAELTAAVSPAPPPPTGASATPPSASAAPQPTGGALPQPAPPAGSPVPSTVPTTPTPEPVAVAAESRPSDDTLVRRALQEYKSAYEALDARSAQAVWPAVNERALARAFEGLESQDLMFDACDVQVNGDAALATCRGTARYVPKVGSREPRTEPRVWTFMLRKRGADWKIDSARAER